MGGVSGIGFDPGQKHTPATSSPFADAIDS
jgi:hypothetical protein